MNSPDVQGRRARYMVLGACSYGEVQVPELTLRRRDIAGKGKKKGKGH